MDNKHLSILPPEILKELEAMSKNGGKAVEVVPEVPKKRRGRDLKIVPDGEGNPVSTCTACHKNDIRKFVKQMTCGVARYENADGRRWRGKNCPDCAYDKHLTYLRKSRGTKKPRV